jgi:Asp-tRNA(Asn)/Glu-tRNA(Gln) amidotransferase A subunit family amidase
MRSERAWIEQRREALRAEVQRLFEEVEVLAMPTTATPPPAASPGLLAGGQDLLALRSIGAYTPLANLCGLAAISVPSGRDDRGRPLSAMFVGRAGSELRLLEIAAAAEATGLGTRPI